MLPVTRLLHGAANCLESNFRAFENSRSSSGAAALEVPLEAPLDSNHVLTRSTASTSDDLRRLMDGLDGLDTDGLQKPVAKPVALLRSLAEACRQQEEYLESEKLRIQRELSEAYNAVGQSEYQLFGIWVHQGQDARSGHYLAFLKDWREDRWMRFSDSSVSFVTWEEVRSAAGVGKSSSLSSTSSAYTLVYMEASLARDQAQGEKEPPISSGLYEEIQADNTVLQNERGTWEQQVKTRELRQHAQAIFQHYAGLLHRWEPRKQVGDNAGNPHDPNHRKMLNDPVPSSFSVPVSFLHLPFIVECFPLFLPPFICSVVAHGPWHILA